MDYRNPIIPATCCLQGAESIRLAKSDKIGISDVGPQEDGWCMTTDASGPDAECVWVNIAYCPWCGKRLPPICSNCNGSGMLDDSSPSERFRKECGFRRRRKSGAKCGVCDGRGTARVIEVDMDAIRAEARARGKLR